MALLRALLRSRRFKYGLFLSAVCLILRLYVAENLSFSLTSLPTTESPHLEKQNFSAEMGPIACHTFKCGRLGNTLFEYASTTGIAMATGKTPFFTDSKRLQSFLKNPPPVLQEDRKKSLLDRCERAEVISDVKGGRFRKELMYLQPNKDYKVFNCLQSYKYFAGRMAEVRELVAFNEDIVSNATRLIQSLRNDHPDSFLVGIHVRRGDITAEYYRHDGWNLPSPDYFRRAMTYFREKLNGSVTFMAVSEDPNWCRDNLAAAERDVVVMEPRSPEVDMQLLSMTDHLIQSIGSFSWWSAFKMANPASTVVYFKDWIIKNSPIDGWFSPVDYMLPDWIPM